MPLCRLVDIYLKYVVLKQNSRNSYVLKQLFELTIYEIILLKAKHLTKEFYIIFSFLYIYGKFTIIYKVVT